MSLAERNHIQFSEAKSNAALKPLAIRWLERPLGIRRLRALYERAVQSGPKPEFFGRFLRELGVTPVITGLGHIPTSGALIITANHPHGFIDGAAVASAVLNIRPDLKIVVTERLDLPEIADYLIPIDRDGTLPRTRKALREMESWLGSGGCVLLFPAGIVAHQPSLLRPPSVEAVWKKSPLRLAEKTGAPVLPVRISGANSRLFNWLGLLHPLLRTFRLPKEALNKRGRTIALQIDAPIDLRGLRKNMSEDEAIATLRATTLALKLGQRPRTPIPDGPSPRELQDAVAILDHKAETTLLSSGPFSAYLFQRTDFDDPARFHVLLDELARLREIEFRKVGKGTGLERDTDEFDNDYSHLVVWNRERQEIVAGWRVARTDLVLRRHGVQGLYLAKQFEFAPDFFQGIGPAIELSRTFVRKEYQSSTRGLPLLFQAICEYMVRNPLYSTFIGGVSISDSSSALTTSLLLEFLRKKQSSANLAASARAKDPVQLNVTPIEVDWSALHSIADLERVAASLDPGSSGIPPLFRIYSNLGGRFLASNHHRRFGSIDTLVVIDLHALARTEPRRLRPYLGRSRVAPFAALEKGTET